MIATVFRQQLHPGNQVANLARSPVRTLQQVGWNSDPDARPREQDRHAQNILQRRRTSSCRIIQLHPIRHPFRTQKLPHDRDHGPDNVIGVLPAGSVTPLAQPAIEEDRVILLTLHSHLSACLVDPDGLSGTNQGVGERRSRTEIPPPHAIVGECHRLADPEAEGLVSHLSRRLFEQIEHHLQRDHHVGFPQYGDGKLQPSEQSLEGAPANGIFDETGQSSHAASSRKRNVGGRHVCVSSNYFLS